MNRNASLEAVAVAAKKVHDLLLRDAFAETLSIEANLALGKALRQLRRPARSFSVTYEYDHYNLGYTKKIGVATGHSVAEGRTHAEAVRLFKKANPHLRKVRALTK